MIQSYCNRCHDMVETRVDNAVRYCAECGQVLYDYSNEPIVDVDHLSSWGEWDEHE